MTLKLFAIAAALAAHPSHHATTRLLSMRAPVTKAGSFIASPMVDQHGRPLPANLPTKQMDPK